MPVAIRNLALTAVLVAWCHWALWFYCSWEPSAGKALWEAATGGIVGAALTIVPDTAKAWFKDAVQGRVGLKSTSVSLGLLSISVTVFSLLLGRADVRVPGQQTVTVDGAAVEGTKSGEATVVSLYGPPWSMIDIDVAGLKASVRPRPIKASLLKVTNEDIRTHSPVYASVRNLLLRAFFQYFENTFLAEAEAALKSPEGRGFSELAEIQPILASCLGRAEPSPVVDRKIETHAEIRPDSAWSPLLSACSLYAARRYGDAVKTLQKAGSPKGPELTVATLFFEGVNNLKVLGERVLAHGDPGSELATRTLLDFAGVQSASSGKTTFFDFARQSAAIFEGITDVYLDRLDDAVVCFDRASKDRDAALSSRAQSDIGYVAMIRGQWSQAENALELARASTASFPAARVNLGFVKMALGKAKDAQTIFQDVVDDAEVAHDSPRDRLLAKAGLAHLVVMSGRIDPAVYDDLLTSMKLYRWENVSNPLLRLAHIHRELADRLYSGPQYYGLEIFALAMDAYAIQETKRVLVVDPTEEGARLILNEALADFQRLKGFIHGDWMQLRGGDAGFFAPIYAVLAQR